MFGLLMSLSLPYILWQTYLNWRTRFKRIFWGLLLLSCIIFLLESLSRASMLFAAFILVGFIHGLKLNKKIYMFSISLMVFIAILLFNPAVIDKTIARYVYKTDTTVSLLNSREKPWERSYEGAAQGGWFGLGYGVSYDDNSDFDFEYGLTSAGYGREKGNSQLALLEETGIVGFILFALLIASTLAKLIKLFIRTRGSENRVLIGIIMGTFIGLISQSIFEAWWTSPMTQESIFFWTLIGIARGIEIVLSRKRIRHEKIEMETQNKQAVASTAY